MKKKHVIVSATMVLLSSLSLAAYNVGAETSWNLFLPAIIGADKSWKELIWQRKDNGKYYTWGQAISYCQNLVLDGHSNWRLPTKEELKSLVVCSNGHPTPRDWQPFGSTQETEYTEATCCMNYPICNDYKIPTIAPYYQTNSWYYVYWSSTPWTSTPPCDVCAYKVDFAFGLTNGWTNKQSDGFARCVRDVIHQE